MTSHRGIPVALVWLILFVVSATPARTQLTAPRGEQVVPQEFCDQFTGLGESAQRDFRELRGRFANDDTEFRTSTLTLPGASHCVISEKSPSLFMCTWKDRPLFALRNDFDLMAKSLKACFPAYKPEELEIEEVRKKYFDVNIPAAGKGGPSRISVRVDAKELWVGVSSWKEEP